MKVILISMSGNEAVFYHRNNAWFSKTKNSNCSHLCTSFACSVFVVRVLIIALLYTSRAESLLLFMTHAIDVKVYFFCLSNCYSDFHFYLLRVACYSRVSLAWCDYLARLRGFSFLYSLNLFFFFLWCGNVTKTWITTNTKVTDNATEDRVFSKLLQRFIYLYKLSFESHLLDSPARWHRTKFHS